MYYLIVYDIRHNRCRTKMAHYLEQQGCQRLQKSVFMGRLPPEKALQIYRGLRAFMQSAPPASASDSLLMLPLERHQIPQTLAFGNTEAFDALVQEINTLFF
ncbi:MAG: hypothetical protein OHK0053_38560 [Microscillaceae bacterium]